MQLPIFPFDPAPLTLTTSIWIGVLIAVFFNQRLGWTLSGLVIPGYLVPIFISRPLTGVVILFQAAITYGLVYAISEWPRNRPYWCSFFGRDRFFVLLATSVLVRSVMDGWLLPWLGHSLVNHFEIHFDYRNNLNSFGLIAVALIANFFWKPGVIMGMVQTAICTSLCFMSVHLLVQTTNFTIGAFDAVYADISLDLLKSPKCYIILLTTAYIASQMNLKYSWDFNGIMIPSLLALNWSSPWIIATAILESALILVVGSLLLRSRLFKGVTMEGGRKLAFFFTICFLYRFLLVHLVERLGYQGSVQDFMGTGYLLSTLIAAKAHDKNIFIRMAKGITEVSMLGAVTGSLIGFGLFCGPSIRFPGNTFQALAASEPHFNLENDSSRLSLSEILRRDKIALYELQQRYQFDPESALELAVFFEAVSDLKRLNSESEFTKIQRLRYQLQRIGYQLNIVEKRYLYLREAQPVRGRGLFVFDTRSENSLAIEIPSPISEWATLESGICLLQEFGAQALAVTTQGDTSPRKSDHASYQTRSLFAEFQRIFGREGLLTVRGFEEGDIFRPNNRNAYQSYDRSESSSLNPANRSHSSASRILVNGRLPDGLNLSVLRNRIDCLEIQWRSKSLHRFERRSGMRWVELWLSESDRIKLVSRLAALELKRESDSPNATSDSKTDIETQIPILHEPLNEWLVKRKSLICPQGSDQYVPASIEQIMFMDSEVVGPLLRVLSHLPSTSTQSSASLRTSKTIRKSNEPCHFTWLSNEVREQLVSIQSSARVLGYQIAILDEPHSNECYVLLSELPSLRELSLETKGWGIFVFRPGLAEPFAVEVPRPLFERRSMDFGAHLFQRPRAAALLIAGAHPRANLDGSSDISKAANRTNLFNLVRHSLLHALGDRPFLITQARAIQAPVETDLVMATEDGTTTKAQLTPLKTQLYNQLASDQLSIQFVDGSPETAGYELGILMQAMSVQISANKEIVSLWLSPALRSLFQEHANDRSLAAQFEACNIPSSTQKLVPYFQATVNELQKHNPNPQSSELSAELRNELKEYIHTMDVLRLFDIRKRHSNLVMQRITDGQSGHSYLMMQTDRESLPVLLNLTGSLNEATIFYSHTQTEQILEFVQSGTRWLIPNHGTSPNSRSHQEQPLPSTLEASKQRSTGANE